MPRFRIGTILLLMVLVSPTPEGKAAEIKVFTSRAVATVLDQVGPEFEWKTGHQLNVVVGLSPEFVPKSIPSRARQRAV